MSWGAMGGLGQAFSDIAGNMAEMDKAKLRDKLEAERELARETRQEARTKRTVAERRLEKVGGKHMWREVNSYGEAIRDTEASPEEVKKIENDAKLSDLTVRKAGADATVAEVTAKDAPDAIQRTIAAHQSGLAKDKENIRASQDLSKRGWAELRQRAAAASAKARESSGADVPDSERALALMHSYKYVLDDAIGAGRINAMEALRQAQDAITQAKANGTDAGKIFVARLGGFTAGNKGGRPGNYGRGLGVLIAPKYQEE